MKERIQEIMNNYGMNTGQFAEELGLNPANISHIISGRNNPSLDVVQKITDRFPNINVMWLLKGEGAMLKSTESQQNSDAQSLKMSQFSVGTSHTLDSNRRIQKITVFFTDGTYQEIF